MVINYATLSDAINDLQQKLDQIKILIETVLNLTLPVSENKPHKLITNSQDTVKFVVNESGLPDTSALYGLLINGKGVAVNNFLFDVKKDYESSNVY